MSEVYITLISSALFALMSIPLIFMITLRRIKIGNIAIGDGNDFDLRKKIETFSNFSEMVPLGLILLALIEIHFPQTLYPLIFAALFTVSRLLHAFGMLAIESPLPRAIAMMIQHSCFLFAAMLLLSILF